MRKGYWYKIVEKKNDNIKTLSHGVNRSRKLERGKWLEAEEKLISDGSSKTKYLSGFHILESFEDAKNYLEKNFQKKDNRSIIVCFAKGVRRKEHSPYNVFLAKNIFIPPEDDMFVAEVGISFDLSKLTQKQFDKLYKIEKLFHEIGISFDTGIGFGFRDWEWDWSLSGPVKVYFKRFKGEPDDEEDTN